VLNESDKDQAIVYFNELQLREIQLNLVFQSASTECNIIEKMTLKTTLLKKIFSLETLQLNIYHQMLDDSLPPTFMIY